MYVEKLVSQKELLKLSRECLGRNPVENLLPLADLYPPLLELSDVFCAIEGNEVVGVCTIFYGFSIPSLVFCGKTDEIKNVLIEKALRGLSSTFISPCKPEEVTLFSNKVKIEHSHREMQMVAVAPKEIVDHRIQVQRVMDEDFDDLNDFYMKQRSEAWTPVQFQVGPFYMIKEEGKIASAAGIHALTPQIAQLGNIVTHIEHRNKGYGTLCTSKLTTDLAKDNRIISLYVAKDNKPAIHVYRKLGFSEVQDIVWVIMQKIGSNESSI